MCLFCKIINKEIPSEIVFESDKVLAIKDVNPLTPNHTLVMPKKHYKNVMDVDSKTLSEVMIVAKALATEAVEANKAKGFNIIINNNEEANQTVDHLHVHIVYRQAVDELNYFSAK